MTASICLRQAEVFQGFLKASQITYKIYLCSLLVDWLLKMELAGITENFLQTKIVSLALLTYSKTWGHWVLSTTYKTSPYPTQAMKSNGKYLLSLKHELIRSSTKKANCQILLKDYHRLKKACVSSRLTKCHPLTSFLPFGKPVEISNYCDVTIIIHIPQSSFSPMHTPK